MPAGRSSKGKERRQQAADSPNEEEDVEYVSGLEADSPGGLEARECSLPAPVKGKKRAFSDVDDEVDFSDEVQAMFQGFSKDMSKSMVSKKKRIEGLAQCSLKTNHKKIEDSFNSQRTERQHMAEEYRKQVMAVLAQWDSDVLKSREAEEKMQTLFKQTQKSFQQQRVTQSQRVKTIRQLHEHFSKSLTELDQCHREQQVAMQSELKKEMGLLQKKILMENQSQGISSVRRSLESMLQQARTLS